MEGDKMTAPRVTIIIVNWNGCHYLPVCLASLAAQSYRDFEVVLVDNGSRDGSLALVQEQYSWVRTIPLERNTGFATGNNIGLEHALGQDYVVALNNDTRVAADWLATLVQTADAHPAAGVVGCRVVAMDEPDLIDSVGHGICRDGMSRGRFRRQHWSRIGQTMGEVKEVLLPTACAALYRRAMVEQIGFFDDDMFAFAEDTDLGLRARRAGWDALVATRAVVEHHYSGTGGVFSAFKIQLVERNHYWVALKTFPRSWLLLLPWYTAVRYLVQVRCVLTGAGSGGEFASSGSMLAIVQAILRGSWEALLGVPLMLRKRSKIMAEGKMSDAEFAVLLKRYELTFRELLDDSGS
jgi:GT2 family glycosyltransferase